MMKVLNNVIEKLRDDSKGKSYIIYKIKYIEDYHRVKAAIYTTDSETTANDIVSMLNQLNSELDFECKKYSDFMDKWKSHNKLEYKYSLLYPKWKPGLSKSDITDEMRSERDEIDRLNKEIREFNYNARCKYDESVNSAYDIYAKKNGYKYTADQLESHESTEYMYELIYQI